MPRSFPGTKVLVLDWEKRIVSNMGLANRTAVRELVQETQRETLVNAMETNPDFIMNRLTFQDKWTWVIDVISYPRKKTNDWVIKKRLSLVFKNRKDATMFKLAFVPRVT